MRLRRILPRSVRHWIEWWLPELLFTALSWSIAVVFALSFLFAVGACLLGARELLNTRRNHTARAAIPSPAAHPAPPVESPEATR
ncbi:hypothetical protein [Actinokineospora sp. NBRC 105648]|uniref:hypothetical protein n=1 Tax=Actinokineospora sp. NBRC 105648 TaxID=3032206 RepID=UPI0024A2BAAF|nr:hypothetical protein [Actinokineospora sp. NBRC 105648]GLZ43521.1 hypothetical protein Acsp05_71450 [Actinokineospora sp. NBRC 105648]